MSAEIVDEPSGRQGRPRPPIGWAGAAILLAVVAAAIVFAIAAKERPDPFLLAAALLGGAVVWFGLLSWTASAERAMSGLVAGQAALDAEGERLERAGETIAAELNSRDAAP